MLRSNESAEGHSSGPHPQPKSVVNRPDKPTESQHSSGRKSSKSSRRQTSGDRDGSAFAATPFRHEERNRMRHRIGSSRGGAGRFKFGPNKFQQNRHKRHQGNAAEFFKKEKSSKHKREISLNTSSGNTSSNTSLFVYR